MAWRVEQKNGTYRAGYRDADGKVRYVKGSFTSKVSADRAGAAAERDSRVLGWRGPEVAAQTWGAWVEHWWTTRQIEPATARQEMSMRRRHIEPQWRNTPLGEIRRQDVRAWSGALVRGGLQPSSAQRILNVFRSSLTAAVDAEILVANPADRVRLTVGQKEGRRYLTRPEAKKLLEHFPDELDLAMVSTLLYCGLRWGEMAGLQVKRVDLERRVIRVAEVWDTTARSLKPYPKSRKARDVPIPDHLVLILQARLSATTTPMVFSRPQEPVPDYSNWRKQRWLPMVASFGEVKIHDLRHTYASWLLQAGIPLEEVGRLLGHADPSTTQIYAHLGEAPVAAIVAALSDVKM